MSNKTNEELNRLKIIENHCKSLKEVGNRIHRFDEMIIIHYMFLNKIVSVDVELIDDNEPYMVSIVDEYDKQTFSDVIDAFDDNIVFYNSEKEVIDIINKLHKTNLKDYYKNLKYNTVAIDGLYLNNVVERIKQLEVTK